MNLYLNNNNLKNYHSNDTFIKKIKNYLNNNKSIDDKTYYSIDRFINNFAVCENHSTGEFINIPKHLIVNSAKTGDILIKKGNKFIIDKEKTIKKQNEIKTLAQSLFKRKKQ